MVLQTWSDVFAQTFQTLWLQVAFIAPKIITALLVFIIGWIVAHVISSIVSQIIRGLRVDSALRSIGVEEAVEHTGMKLDSGKFLGLLIRWFIVVGFLIVSVNVLGLSDVNVFLGQIVGYLPRVFIAAVILLIAAIVGQLAQKVVVGSGKATGVPSAQFAGVVARWSIWIFALLIACQQLLIAPEFVQTLYSGIIAMLALAGGLAFGLGGKETAGKILADLHREITGK
jgi:hypothetical protein